MSTEGTAALDAARAALAIVERQTYQNGWLPVLIPADSYGDAHAAVDVALRAKHGRSHKFGAVIATMEARYDGNACSIRLEPGVHDLPDDGGFVDVIVVVHGALQAPRLPLAPFEDLRRQIDEVLSACREATYVNELVHIIER